MIISERADMKRKTAKEILAESFMELAAKRAVDKITVRDMPEEVKNLFWHHFM